MAYEMAGIGPEDVDLVELHDAFAPEEIVHYEDLGLCKVGKVSTLSGQGPQRSVADARSIPAGDCSRWDTP